MSINNCTFSGRLTKDPELKMVKFGEKEVESCVFSIAIDKGYGEKKRAIFPS